MRAIILAAGRGSRMGSLTDEKPKCMAVVRGRPLIEHQVSALKGAGVDEIGIVTGYKSKMLEPYGDKHFHNPLWASTNMVSSLLCAKEWLEESDCLISYSDIFYESQVIRDLMACEDDLAISYDPNWLELWSKRFENPLDDAESFRVDKEGYLIDIGRKVKSVEEIEGQYMGLLKFRKEFWSSAVIQSATGSLENIDMTSFLRRFLEGGIKIKAAPNKGLWGECDSQEDIAVQFDILD